MIHTTPPPVLVMVANPSPAKEAATAGVVLDSEGKPISGVFVQASGLVASAITDTEGNFAISLPSSADINLEFSAPGFLTKRVPSSAARRVTLSPLPVYRPAFAPPAAVEAPAPAHLFATQIGASQQARYLTTTAGIRSVSGWATNEFAGDARFRAQDVVLGFSGFRNKAQVMMAGLSAQPSPQPAVEQSQWTLSAGYGLAWGGIEFLPQVSYVNTYFVPSSTAAPWTGTPLDFSQTRQGVGVGLDAGSRVGPVDLIARVKAVPWQLTTLSAAPYAAPNPWDAEVGLLVGYLVAPGLRTDVTLSRWLGQAANFNEWADIIGVGLTYQPERVTTTW